MIGKNTEKCEPYSGRKSGNRNWPRWPDAELSRQQLQSSCNKYVQRVQENQRKHDHKGKYDNNDSKKKVLRGILGVEKVQWLKWNIHQLDKTADLKWQKKRIIIQLEDCVISITLTGEQKKKDWR